MPIFRSNADIFKYGTEESFDSAKFDLNNVFIPPSNKKWNYEKELTIENIELWEVIYEESGQIGVYAAWEPYAEFYMIRNKLEIEVYYGKGALQKTVNKMKNIKIPVNYNSIWVENEDMWLYS
jgi:hypothetical protein